MEAETVNFQKTFEFYRPPETLAFLRCGNLELPPAGLCVPVENIFVARAVFN